MQSNETIKGEKKNEKVSSNSNNVIIFTVFVKAWEINTHRAIDQEAIKKSSNLASFIKDSQIDNIFEKDAIAFDGYRKNYIEYILNGEKNGISNWKQE